MKIAVFLDRDGVLNQDPPHYAHRLDQLALIPRSDDAIKLLKDNGFLAILISNLSGVALGYYYEDDVSLFNNAPLKEIQKNGGHIDDIYYCLHHPDAKIEKYKLNCNCRKSKPGMLHKAAQKYDIDLKRSFVAGDKLSDIEAGKNAGCQTILVLTGHVTDESLKMKDYKIAFKLYSGIESEHDNNRTRDLFRKVMKGIDNVLKKGFLTSILTAKTHTSHYRPIFYKAYEFAKNRSY